MMKMEIGNEKEKYVLGSGGKEPGVFLYSTLTRQNDPFIKAAPFHSIYALGIETETGIVAGGSRNGIFRLTHNLPNCRPLETGCVAS